MTNAFEPPNEPNPVSVPAALAADPAEAEPQGMVRSAAILAAGNVASRLLGLARESVKADLFGASGRLSAYEIAVFVPMSLYELIVGGMVNSALVPVFSDFASLPRRQELWSVVSTVLSVAAAILLAVVALIEILAPQIAWLVGANEFDDPRLAVETVRLMRLAAPAVLFMSLASILTAALYALRRFTLPAFVGAVFNGTIVVAALLRPDKIESLVWGMLLGSVLQILFQLPALRDARLRWNLSWRHPVIRRILALYAPIAVALIVNQLAVALSYNLATRTGDQSVSYMRFATTLYQFPLGLVVTALSIATLPTLARQAQASLEAYKTTLAEGIRLVVALILPATAGLLVLAVPIVALLFEGQEFTRQDTLATATVLRFYLLGLPFAAVDQMLVFASYARKDTWRPALVGIVSILVYSMVAVLLLPPLGLLSLMVADAVKHVVHALIMIWFLGRTIGGLAGFGIGPTVLKSMAGSALSGGTAYLTLTLMAGDGQPVAFASKLVVVVACGAAGLVAYIIAVQLLDIREIKSLRVLFHRRSAGAG